MPPRFPYLEVELAAELADELAYELCDLGSSGVEQRDDSTLDKGPGADRVTLVASFATLVAAERVGELLGAQHPQLTCRVGELVGDDWRDRYKEFFRPFSLTPSVLVVPSWSEPPAGSAAVVLRMDPGRAFGTGLHATTALVAEQLEQRRADFEAKHVLDVGTGSGVLALVALLLGAEGALAIDNDADVIDVAQENAARNGLDARIRVEAKGLEAVDETFPFVVANIRAGVLIDMAAALCERVRVRGTLVLSGVLASEREEVLSAYVAAGFAHVETTRRGDGEDAWVAIVVTRVER